MNIFEQTLRQLLIQVNVVDDRVFLGRAPQVPAAKQYTPYLTFFHVAPSPHYDQEGPLRLMDRDYQISIYDPSQSQAWAIGDTIRDYLERFRGDFIDTRFWAIFHRTATFAWESDTELYQVVQQYRILYALLGSLSSTNRSTNSNTTRSPKRSIRI